MNRRNLYKVAFGFFGMSVLPDIRALASPAKVTLAQAQDWYWCSYGPIANSFSELEAWLKQLPCEQKDGSPTAVCDEIGELYITHKFVARARPGDEVAIEGDVTAAMQWSISHAIELKRPKRGEDVVLHWRERPSFDIGPLLAWSEAKEELVPIWDWRHAMVYARLAVSLKA